MSEKTDGHNKPVKNVDVDQERVDERALFARYQADPSPENEEALVEKYRPLVYRIAHKFKKMPDMFEDLVQEGTKGLLLAIRRFDLSLNYRFSTYAWQTIQGEIQRYFRDRTWAVNVPRDLKEKSLRVFNTHEELTKQLGHEPTVAELSQRTNLSEEEVQEAMELGSAYHPHSFMDNTSEGDYGVILGSGLGKDSYDMSLTKRGIFWDSLLRHLSETEAAVVRLYYFEELTQKEIANQLATSQMNVSRIMRKAQSKLRRIITSAEAGY